MNCKFCKACPTDKFKTVSRLFSLVITIPIYLWLYEVGDKDLDFVVMALASSFIIGVEANTTERIMCGKTNRELILGLLAFSFVLPSSLHLLTTYIYKVIL